jgi:hypothetical protein
MRAGAGGDLTALQRIRFYVFDQPAWEEGILFAVDRLSREGDGSSVLAKAIIDALPVDPMLAAEMIYRSPPPVWEIINPARYGRGFRYTNPIREIRMTQTIDPVDPALLIEANDIVSKNRGILCYLSRV